VNRRDRGLLAPTTHRPSTGMSHALHRGARRRGASTLWRAPNEEDETHRPPEAVADEADRRKAPHWAQGRQAAATEPVHVGGGLPGELLPALRVGALGRDVPRTRVDRVHHAPQVGMYVMPTAGGDQGARLQQAVKVALTAAFAFNVFERAAPVLRNGRRLRTCCRSTTFCQVVNADATRREQGDSLRRGAFARKSTLREGRVNPITPRVTSRSRAIA
jgi:hypothetical protein